MSIYESWIKRANQYITRLNTYGYPVKMYGIRSASWLWLGKEGIVPVDKKVDKDAITEFYKRYGTHQRGSKNKFRFIGDFYCRIPSTTKLSRMLIQQIGLNPGMYWLRVDIDESYNNSRRPATFEVLCNNGFNIADCNYRGYYLVPPNIKPNWGNIFGLPLYLLKRSFKIVDVNDLMKEDSY